MTTKQFITQFVILTLSLLVLESCYTNIPLTNDYYNNQKRVGIVFNIDSISYFRGGTQGLLDMALTAGAKYKEPLAIVDKDINPTKSVKQAYKVLFKSKGKELKELDFNYDIKRLQKFVKPSGTKKKYHSYDLRFFKQNEVDEIVIVQFKYGLTVNYAGFIEGERLGGCYIFTDIINVNDNSIIYQNHTTSEKPLQGKWKTPPKYENLAQGIDHAVINALQMEMESLDK